MKKSTLIIAILGSLPFVTPVHAEEVRLVVKNKSTVSSQAVSTSVLRAPSSVGSEICIETVDGAREICVPNPKTQSHISTNSKMSKSSVKNIEKDERHYAFSVDADSAQQAIDTLNSTGWYAYVERDVEVFTGEPDAFTTGDMVSTNTSTVTNDPWIYLQKYHKSSTAADSGVAASNFAPYLTREALAENSTKVGVMVIDSVFHEFEDELIYKQGSNFSVLNGYEARGNDFITPIDPNKTCTPHGSGVASVIASTADNGLAFVGAAGNVDLYVAQSLECGKGMLSDAASALRWAAKDSFTSDGIDNISGDVKVVNLSLGGKYSYCPTFFQEAVDYAVNRGLTVVVAAGNDAIDVSGFAPANCKNVIVVGATNLNGEKLAVSNYGGGIDITAGGSSVAGMGYNISTPVNWSGTSFAAPFVTSAVTHAYRENPNVKPAMVKLALKMSAKHNDDVQCEMLGCGAGMLDVPNFLYTLKLIENGEANTISHALTGENECDQSFFVDKLGQSARLCEMFEAKFLGDLTGDSVYKIYRTDKLGGSAEFVTSTQSSKMLLSGDAVDVDAFTYDVVICDDEECTDSSLKFPLDTSLATEETKPVACKP